MGEFEGKAVLVTGAASGIGRAIALAFAEAGAAVVGLDLTAGATDPLRFTPIVPADLRDEEQVVSAVASAAERLGKLDILVNCAGTDGEQSLANFDIRDFDRIFGVNVRGTLLVTREVLKHMGEGGRIVNILSELAFTGRREYGCYSGSKGALLSMTRSWARELAPSIQVNAVAPGPIAAPMLRWDQISEAVRQEELGNPAGRIGQPAEVARAVLFLAHPKSTFITGQCLNVDGGAAMH